MAPASDRAMYLLLEVTFRRLPGDDLHPGPRVLPAGVGPLLRDEIHVPVHRFDRREDLDRPLDQPDEGVDLGVSVDFGCGTSELHAQ